MKKVLRGHVKSGKIRSEKIDMESINHLFLDIILLKINSKLRKKGYLSLDVERQSIILIHFIYFCTVLTWYGSLIWSNE